ncbi:hypothetical protein EXIGLDRAFT_506111 [Exidia glandulosa HHB12029]|uniref:Uncharacterized protein n=1 Tax=Exidia glandulosa HHB12029 TaxID=1314781 RepID=A0A165JBI9_EXIGL|nr:hypothetical protein EXIGLDRAFT_506111 [Exidia glandulosa HHB12029]
MLQHVYAPCGGRTPALHRARVYRSPMSWSSSTLSACTHCPVNEYPDSGGHEKSSRGLSSPPLSPSARHRRPLVIAVRSSSPIWYGRGRKCSLYSSRTTPRRATASLTTSTNTISVISAMFLGCEGRSSAHIQSGHLRYSPFRTPLDPRHIFKFVTLGPTVLPPCSLNADSS